MRGAVRNRVVFPGIFLLTLFLLSGCGAKRRAVQSQRVTSEQTWTGSEAYRQETVQTDYREQREREKDEEVETVTHRRVYDTAKPVDPATGKPPLKAEETTRRVQRTRQTATRQMVDSSRRHAQTIIRDSTRKEATADETVKAKETRRPFVPGWLVWTGLLALAAAGWGVYRKCLKKK